MKKRILYLFLELKILSGEHEFSSRTVHEVEYMGTVSAEYQKLDAIQKFADDYAKNFYDGGSETDSDYYSFNGGSIMVRAKTTREISKAEYEVMKKFL